MTNVTPIINLLLCCSIPGCPTKVFREMKEGVTIPTVGWVCEHHTTNKLNPHSPAPRIKMEKF